MITTKRRHFKQIPLLEFVDENLAEQILPTIIYYHGWHSKKELVMTNSRKLAEKGFRVLAPDALNHGERIGEVSTIPSFTFWQTIQANIVEFNQIVDHGQKLGMLDSQQIGVCGVSMGGITASALLVANPQIEAGACLMGTPDILAYQQMIINYAKNNGNLMPQPFLDTLSFWKKFDAASNLDRLLNRPFFIWHDQLDPRIPYLQVEAFIKNAQNKPGTRGIEFVQTNEYGHLLTPKIMDQVTDFFVKAMK